MPPGGRGWRGAALEPSTWRRLAAAAMLVSFLLSALALWLGGPAKTLGIRDYVSDEVWYVSSAVNVARKVLGLDIVPWVNGSWVVFTVFYDNASCSRAEAVKLVEEHVPGAMPLQRNYTKAVAVAFKAPLSSWSSVEELMHTNIGCIVDVMPGVAPDQEGINSYLNTEHPPLVKYVIAAMLRLMGWSPAAWRLPSYAVLLLGLASAAYIGYLVLVNQRPRLLLLLLVAAVPVAAALRDPALRSMSGVGMLDAYVAGFDAAAVAALAAGRRRLSGLLLGLASASKYTGIFPAPLVFLETRFSTGSTLRAATYSLVVPLLVVAAFWAPFAARYGPGWVLSQVAFAASWETTSRPPNGPPSTNPLGLLLAWNPFVLYYAPDGRPLLVAACNPGLCVAGVIVAAAALAEALSARAPGAPRPPGAVARLLWAASAPLWAWLGYVAVYAAGNHTLYTFYTVQISVLSIASIEAIPLVFDWWGLARSGARYLASREATPLRAAIAAATGVAAAAARTGAWPVGGPDPFTPLSYALGPGKADRAALLAAALLLYPVAAHRYTARRGMARGAAEAAWLAAGLLSYAAPLAPLAPVLLLAAESPGLAPGFLAGLVAPVPGSAGLASAARGLRERLLYLLGLAAGAATAYLVAAAAATPPPPSWAWLAAMVVAAAAAAAAASLPEPWPGLSLAAATSPAGLPALAALPGPRGPLYAALAAAALYTAGPRWALLVAAAAFTEATAEALIRGAGTGCRPTWASSSPCSSATC